jgi:hypothetical protein
MSELRLEGKALEDAKHSTFADAEKLLALAERLQLQAEQHDARYARYELGILGIIACLTLLVPVLMALQAGKLISEGMTTGVLIAAIVEAVLGIIYCWIRWSEFARMRDSERRLMQRLIDMLREIEGAFSLDDHVSVLERVGFQTRLARFGIGTGTRPNQNGSS